MRERTEYRENRELDYERERARENLQELEERLREKTDDRNPMVWPGGYRDPEAGDPTDNFQAAAQAWWREHGGELDPVQAELRLYDQGLAMLQHQDQAREMGIRMAETVREMVQDYREMGYQVTREEAAIFAGRASENALDAQEMIGHPVYSRTLRREFNAYTLQSELEDHLAGNGGRSVDPERVGAIFSDMERLLQYSEKIQALETDPGAGEQDILDRHTQELLEWAIRSGEFHRWTQADNPGLQLNETSEKLFQMAAERDRTIQEAWGQAPDPGEEIPEHVLRWARATDQDETWLEDYREALDALEGRSPHGSDLEGEEQPGSLPRWATTARGTLRRQGAEQLRKRVEARIAEIESSRTAGRGEEH